MGGMNEPPMVFVEHIQKNIVSVEDLSDDLFQRLRVMFKNGYGASIVQGEYSYGGKDGLFEIGVLDGEGNLAYDTPVTDDVLGHLDRDGVAEVLEEIMTLPSLQEQIESEGL